MRYRCEILNHGIDGYEVWLHGRNQGRSGVNDNVEVIELPGNFFYDLFFIALSSCRTSTFKCPISY